ncbi:MAG: nitroreductase family protein [Phocaeicola sp.]
MKHLSTILNVVLATALTALVIKPSITQSDNTPATMQVSAEKNETIESILNRTSVRSYTSQKVESEKVELLLRAAMAAPTAVNKQPWAFIVVDDRALLDTLAANLPYAKMTAEANLAIVVCGNLDRALTEVDRNYWIQDCSAATENLLLAAHSLGLGAVWTGVFPRKERIEAVRNILNIPSNLVPLNVIPIGYPNGETKAKEKFDAANIYRNQF